MASNATTSLSMGRVLSPVSLYKIDLTDGTSLYLTNAEFDIEFEGNTYTHDTALVSSAVQALEGLENSNLDLIGAITTSKITDEDLLAGVLSDARVEHIVVDQRWPHLGHMRRATYVIGQVTSDDEQWTAEMSGITGLVKTKVGTTLTRNCPHRLGSGLCSYVFSDGVNSFDKTVTAVDADEPYRIFSANLSGLTGSEFADGVIEWTSGQNAGLSSEVRSADASTGQIELHLSTKAPITTSDAFTIKFGCNGTHERCKALGRINDFGGQPFIPGQRQLYSTPNSKT